MSSDLLVLPAVLTRLDTLTHWARRPRTALRVDLAAMVDLMRRLGDPHRGYGVVHVAGTKGKGSVCALVEAGLLRAGYRVGRYASPHVEHITERISIDGELVGEAVLASALTRVIDVYEGAKAEQTAGQHANWFDLLTAAALLTFQQAAIEWAVVEVGLGGRIDSTNVVTADIAVVTNIELEHTDLLGATRDLIAGEKVGILKPGAVLVTGVGVEDPVFAILRRTAQQLGCRLRPTFCPPDASITEQNRLVAAMVLSELGDRGLTSRTSKRQNEDRSEHRSVADQGAVGAWLLDDATRAAARLPGRQERFDIDVAADRSSPGEPLSVVLDGAHVPFNLAGVMRELVAQPGLSASCVAVVALAADKDAHGLLRVLAGYAASLVVTTLPGAVQGHSPEALARIAESLGVTCEIQPDSTQAYQRALQLAALADSWVLVTGSMHLVGALRGEIRRSARAPAPPARSTLERTPPG